MSFVYHQFCIECKHILTIREMDLHLKDGLGLCNDCRDKKRHAETFKERFAKLGEEK
jgi:hypothetical protein